MDRPYVQLLGRARVKSVDGWCDFLPEKRYQLLAYLAYAGDWVTRDHLAYLFWPRAVTQTARGNLRSLLERVRDVTWLTGLDADRNRLRWQVTSDAGALQAALERGRLVGGEPQAIVTLYTGRLLEGLESYDGSEFANWLELERESLYGRWREGMLRQVELSAERADRYHALGLLEVMLSHDGLDEEAVRLYLSIAARQGRRDRAMRVYHEFAKNLHRELGLRPADGTQRIARQLEHDDATPARPVAAPDAVEGGACAGHPSMPVPVTSFVGRLQERAEIARLLEPPECRLLTLVGHGGIGKTRLALHVANDLCGRYDAGCCFVSLESLSLHDAIPAAIAAALQLEPGPQEPLAQVIQYLEEKSALLVLDNFEHLIEGAPLLPALLSRCPKVDLLVTSRERLNLTEEWLLVVEGLSYPGDPSGAGPALAFDAVELFVQRAQRHAPHWVLNDEDAPHVMRICHLLEGNPLALELAAVWARLMPCADIVSELESDLDFLSASARNAADRHASMRASFEHSWRLLSAVEQDGLRELSVFRGGITREAAAVVADVAIPVLVSLVDKSLLRIDQSGRYDRHPLLYQFCREKLRERPEQEARLQERHAEYYFRLLIESGSRFHGPQHDRAMAVLGDDLINIMTAWKWAITTVRVRELQQATAPLQQFFELQARGREGAEVFGQMVAALSEADPDHHAALGFALISHGYFLHPTDANRMTVLQSGLSLLRQAQEGPGILWGLYVLGLSAVWAGDRVGARQYFDETLLLATREGDTPTRADCLTNLARLLQDGGEYDEAIRLAQEAVSAWQSLGDEHGEVWALVWLGLSTLRSGRPDEADLVMERALAMARGRDDMLQAGLLTAHRGLLAHARGDLALARALHVEALGMMRGGLGVRFTKPMCLADLGRIETALGNDTEAEARFAESLELAAPHGWSAHMLSAIAGVAALRAREGRHATALELAFLVLHHAATEHVHREQVRALIDGLCAAMPPDAVARAVERSRTMRLEDASRTLTGQWRPPWAAGLEA